MSLSIHGDSTPPPQRALPCWITEVAPAEIANLIFSYLFDDFRNAIAFSSTCRDLRDLKIHAFHEYLSRKEFLDYDEILRLSQFVYRFLIDLGPEFQAIRSDEHPERQAKLWKDHAIPHVCEYVVRRCPNVQILDLSHERYSVSTALGCSLPFQIYEVATLDLEEPVAGTASMEQTLLIDPMAELFRKRHRVHRVLYEVHTLVLTFLTTDDDTDETALVEATFPNLEIIVVPNETLQKKLKETVRDVEVKISGSTK